mmetsp:Transcript_25656/g.77951  ORF Transcript_25656/g.77951 Transcript_25656/m.77951 type:complete len:109 (-) Transcript_25656:298-624(-)
MPGCQQRGPSRQIYHNYVPSHPVLTALSAPGKLFRAEYEEREPGDRDGVALLGGGGDDLTGGVGRGGVSEGVDASAWAEVAAARAAARAAAWARDLVQQMAVTLDPKL